MSLFNGTHNIMSHETNKQRYLSTYQPLQEIFIVTSILIITRMCLKKYSSIKQTKLVRLFTLKLVRSTFLDTAFHGTLKRSQCPMKRSNGPTETLKRLGHHAYFFLFDWLQGGNPRERHRYLQGIPWGCLQAETSIQQFRQSREQQNFKMGVRDVSFGTRPFKKNL